MKKMWEAVGWCIALAFTAILVWLGFPERVVSWARDNSVPARRLVSADLIKDDHALLFVNPDVDLGATKLKEISHTFKFKNISKNTIKIFDVRSPCACTITRLDRSEYASGESGTITAKVDLANKPPSSHKFVIDVIYRDSVERTKSLSLAVQTASDIRVAPDMLKFTVGDQVSSLKFKVIDSRPEPLKITSYSSSSPSLTVKTVELPHDYLAGWVFIAEATVDGKTLDPGVHRETVIVHTNDNASPEIPISINITKLDRIQVNPSFIVLRDAGDGNRVIGKFFVRDVEGEDIHFEKISGSSDLLDINVDQDPAPIRSVTVSVDQGNLAKLPSANQISIRIKHPCNKDVSVAVWGQSP